MINKILKFDLCTGCGLCASVLEGGKCSMELTDRGFYIPRMNSRITRLEKRVLKRLCPGIHVESNVDEGHWGSVLSIAEAWSSNPVIRHKAASGGAVSALAIYLLEKEKIDAVLQVGVSRDDCLRNELKISRTKSDIIANAQSRYAPALVFDNIKSILESNNDVYAFIGKPCDVAAMQNLINEFPRFKGRIAYYISIFCAGMPSYEGTKKICLQSGRTDKPISIRYRGEGWPGSFEAKYSDGYTYRTSYNESWGDVLSRHLPFRCKICPDGIGMLADISVGDSWSTKDGYPDFAEADGRSFCMIRTQNGKHLMNDAVRSGNIIIRDLDLRSIRYKQPYQYERRKLTGWRLLPVQILSLGLINFRGLGVWRLSMQSSLKTGILNMYGTFKRIFVQLRNHGK